jgi:glycosyltransferase involved in cell wall biosynthesis
MKILISSPSLEPRLSGVSIRYKNLLKGLAKIHDVYVVGYDTDFHKYLPKNIKGYYYFSNLSIPTYDSQKIFNIFLTYPYIIYIYYILTSLKIDIVHIAGPDTNFIPWVEVTNILKIHLVYAHHTDIVSYLDTRPLLNNVLVKNIIISSEKYIMNNSSVTWLMSNFFLERLENKHGYFKNKKPNIKILDVGVDRILFKPTYIPEYIDLWIPNTTRLLIISRISSEKYIEFVIDTVKNISSASLLIIGAGPDEDIIKDLSNKIDNVNFIGYIPHEKLAPYYSMADFFIQPSNNETLGFTILESLACGTPVINCKDCSSFIINGYNGFTYPFGNKKELTLLIDSLKNHKRFQYKENSIQSIKKYKWENVILMIDNTYKELIKTDKKRKVTLFMLLYIFIIIYYICNKKKYYNLLYI